MALGKLAVFDAGSIPRGVGAAKEGAKRKTGSFCGGCGRLFWRDPLGLGGGYFKAARTWGTVQPLAFSLPVFSLSAVMPARIMAYW